MSANAVNLCCTHPRQQLDSPEPPSRPITTIDSIFAAAALPADHPHALNLPDRKPELNASILRSPGFASKIKLQFQRWKSKVSLGKEKGYDLDARGMTLQEALDDTGDVKSDEPAVDTGAGHPRFGSVTPGGEEGEVHLSVVKSIGYLKPYVQDASDVTEGEQVNGMAELATTIASTPHSPGSLTWKRMPLSPVLKSTSWPLLPQGDGCASMSLRHSRSDSHLQESLTKGPTRLARPSPASTSLELSGPSLPTSPEAASQPAIPIFHIREATSEAILAPAAGTSPTEPKPMSSEDSLHLQKMAISQKLRSMSQLSDVVEDEFHAVAPDLWTFHRRERSDIASNSKSGRRARHASSSGMDSTTVPSSWGRVRSPMPDAASSIYSRPTSAGGSGSHRATPDQGPHMPTVDLDALFSDWPLKTSASVKCTDPESDERRGDSGESERRNKPLPPTPSDSRKDSCSASFVTAANDAEPASIRWLSPAPFKRAASIISDSSSVMTKTSKHSKFLERLSPPKKTVKKRRSILKFLRPSSRKQQGRSISTPTLTTCSQENALSFDGQSEDPALLTVQYELDERPGQSRRAASMNNLLSAAEVEDPSQPQTSRGLERRPTLADYERHLSVIGDDRRRPSTVNVDRVKEVQADDHRASVGMRRRLSRARPLKDDASPLMAQALEKHQQEKALFRSASKQRESLKSSARTAPVFNSSPFSFVSPVLDDASELILDPSDKGKASTVERSRSRTYLLPPGPVQATSLLGGISSPAASVRSSAGAAGFAEIPVAKKRIGTALESWSRYPSYSRAERCGSAGRPDNVITRDFAVDINHAEIHSTDDADETRVANTDDIKEQKSKRLKKALAKSRSMTFDNIGRYYRNIFSSSSVAQNRRTSVTIGGKLEFPELEILAPQMAAEPLGQPKHKRGSALHRFKEHAKEDADRIKDFVIEEEEKVEEFVKEEEDKFETFVRREEDEFEGFVKKEEDKLKAYVREEEDKLKQHWHNRPSGRDRDSSPFREISLVEVPHERGKEAKSRMLSISVGPNDDLEEKAPGVTRDSATDADLRLDGASTTSTLKGGKPSSKAELWSEVYRECLARPSSAAKEEAPPPATPSVSMPPPQLKPAKARSPEQTGSTATIRRFPSVTVIDDRKGHFRSISLISVKTGSSAGFDQTSTHELLELVQARERRERNKVLKGVEGRRLSSIQGAK